MSGGRERDWFGVRGRAMAPGEELTLCPEGILLAPGTRLQIRLRFLLNGDPNRERQTRDVPHFDLSLNDRPVWSNARFTMYHDVSSQFLEESVIEVEARETEEAVRRLTPVSYTHLDVYKRQVSRLLGGCALCSRPAPRLDFLQRGEDQSAQ